MFIRSMTFLCLLTVCSSCALMRPQSQGLYDIGDEEISVDEQAVIDGIAELAKGRDPDDAESSMAFDEAVHNLTLMGSTIEPYLIEALVGDDDWAVRYGVIHVLDSIGTKNCVVSLIGTLKDEHPLVAQKAMYSLRVFCEHREVPESGGVAANGLPPIPARAADDMRRDAEYQIWLVWYGRYGETLYVAWDKWWDENVHLIRID